VVWQVTDSAWVFWPKFEASGLEFFVRIGSRLLRGRSGVKCRGDAKKCSMVFAGLGVQEVIGRAWVLGEKGKPGYHK
jgi:hypothetical protein